MSNQASAIYYASNCFTNKISKKDLEIVKKDPDYSVQYASSVLKKRWVEAEPYLLDDKFLNNLNSEEHHYSICNIIEYCQEVIKGRWKELEQKIIELKLSSLAFEYALHVLKGPWEDAEEIIAIDSQTAFIYASDVLEEHRFEIAEENIKKDPQTAIRYAEEIIKNRWPEAEPYILNSDNDCALLYCEKLVKGRWPELEPKVISNANDSMRYVEITKKRWPEFEKRLIKLRSPQKIVRYMYAVGKVSQELHNKMILLSFEGKGKYKEKVDQYFYIIEQKKKKHRQFLNKVTKWISKHKDKKVEEVLEVLANEEYSHVE